MEEDFIEIRRIGKGAEGSVYLVERVDNGQEFVIKKIFLKGNRSTSIHEAKILSQLKHPHVVRYHDSFVDRREEHLCIVTDYCEGGNLDQRIRATQKANRTISEERAMGWFVQIAVAMQYIHSKKFLHRDLKTANIFLTKHDIIKVGDFGIAAQLEHTLDMKHTCVGSPYYMSPEVCQDIPYNNKSDVWAMGCVLYELCCLKPAFGGNNLMKIVNKIVGGSYEPLPDRYSSDLHDLVDKMLQVESANRPSVAEILCLPYVKRCLKSFIESTERRQLEVRAHAKEEAERKATELALEGTIVATKRHKKSPRRKKMSKADSGYLNGILAPRSSRRSAKGVPNGFVLTGTTTTLQKQKPKSAAIPVLSVRPPTARTPTPKRTEVPHTSRSHPPLQGYSAVNPGSPQRVSLSRASADRSPSRGSERGYSRGSQRSTTHSRGSSVGDNNDREVSPTGSSHMMPPIHRRSSNSSDEGEVRMRRTRSLKASDREVPNRPRTRSDTNVMEEERDRRHNGHTARTQRKTSRSPNRSPTSREEHVTERAVSQPQQKQRTKRAKNTSAARSHKSAAHQEGGTSTKPTKKPLPGSPRLSNVRTTATTKGKKSVKGSTTKRTSNKSATPSAKPKKTRRRSLAPTPTARRSVEEPVPHEESTPRSTPNSYMLNTDTTVPSDIASQFEALLRQRCDMESTDYSSSGKSTLVANGLGAHPAPHDFVSDTLLSEMSRISTPSHSEQSDEERMSSNTSREEQGNDDGNGDGDEEDATIDIMEFGGQKVMSLAQIDDDYGSDSFESVTESSGDEEAGNTRQRSLSPDSLDDTDDEDVMAVVDLARVALSSRAEDYSDKTIEEDRTIATPPKALLRAHCLEALGDTVFQRAYEYYRDVTRKRSSGSQDDDEAKNKLEPIVGKQNLGICRLVRELVALETRKFGSCVAQLSKSASDKLLLHGRSEMKQK